MRRLLIFTLALWFASSSAAAVAQDVSVDLREFQPPQGVTLERQATQLRIGWPFGFERGNLVLELAPDKPLIAELGATTGLKPDGTILKNVDPVTCLTVGSRDLSSQGWSVFFDNPPRRPHETFLAKLSKKSVRVTSRGSHTTVHIEELTAGPFRGELCLTVYPNCRLIHVEAVLSTTEDARAILYDAGLASATPSWKSVMWIDTNDKLVRVAPDSQPQAAPLAVRHRAIVAEGESGCVAVFPPPHQYLYPLDFSDNFKFAWHGKGFQKLGDLWGFGVRQPPEGDKRYVPWINAPPGTQQRLGVFYLLSAGGADKALEEVRRFTHGDRYEKLAGHRTFTSHFHVEHTLDYLQKQREQETTGIPKGLEDPQFVQSFKKHGVDIAHLAEFHVNHNRDFIRQRLPQLSLMHDECRRLSTPDFLLLPGEEPNVHLGGHWISFFPKPVYWLLHPEPGTPFERQVEGLGTVYAVHNAADILKLMEKEKGLMWTAHPRTKSSYGFPDRYRMQDFYRSDRFLGAAWKAMPADLSLPRLGTRSLDLLSDMANWGQPKYVLGEVDVFKVQLDHELYGHMNINYLRLDKIPRFDDGWQPVLDALRSGAFFVTTGEVLLPDFRVGGKQSGETLARPAGESATLTAKIQWTFPPAYAEIITGDGEKVMRQRIDLSQHAAFGSTELSETINLKGVRWVRLEVWDIATNGAFTQPVWVN